MLKRRLLLGSGGGGSGGKLLPPVLSDQPGFYQRTGSLRLTLTNPNPSGTSFIKYTINGTEPTETNGTTYSSYINITAPGKVVYAVCVPSSSNNGYSISDVSGGEYVIANKPIEPPRISPTSGTYTSNINVSMVHENVDGNIYYSYGEFSDPINSGTLYNNSFTISTNGDYYIKAVCLANGSGSEVVRAEYKLNKPPTSIPEPFASSSIIVRMYLESGSPSQIISQDYLDYNNNPEIRVLISDGTNGSIIEYNNYTRIDNVQNWDGTYTVSTSGYYFVIVVCGQYIPSYLFKETSVTEIEFIHPDVTKIGDPVVPGYTGQNTTLEDECAYHVSMYDEFCGAFYNCTSLEKITISYVDHTTYDSSYLHSGEGLEAIGASSFGLCKNVREFSLPDNIQYICTRAFEELAKEEPSLREIYLPSRLLYIGHASFIFCRFIQDYHLERCTSLTHILDVAFYGNCSLTSITIPKYVTTIQSSAFSSINISSASTSQCCRLVEVINLSNINLSPATNHPSGIGKYCLSYRTSGTSNLQPRILSTVGYQFLTVDNIKYLVQAMPYDNGTVTGTCITLPTDEGYFVINTAAFLKIAPTEGWGSWIFTEIELNMYVTELKDYAFGLTLTLSSIRDIYLLTPGGTGTATYPPTIYSNTFTGLGNNGTLHYFGGVDVSSWVSNSPNYLGYKNWSANMYTP